MKAEHRKELQTNYLADHLGKLIQHRQQITSYVWIPVLIVAVIVGYWWWSTRTAASVSASWVEFWAQRDSAEAAGKVASRHKGTSTERAAKLAEADNLFADGYREFFLAPDRAKELFIKAKEAYEQTGKNAGGSQDLAVRALLGQAKCEEWLGDIDSAKRHYQDLANRYRDHPLADEADRNLKKLENSSMAAFYKDWPKRLPAITSTAPSAPPPAPPLEPPSDPALPPTDLPEK